MNLIKNVTQFFQDAYYELAKVTWLGRKEVVGTTVVVVVFVVIMSIFVSIVDLFLGAIVGIML
ncbi:MAG: preprotein translocase subunit SecE [Endomicrobium sp.]|uniref:preprotein translocase subunit SecE n=1 Tax=Candidatus Endomicrobiellum pyrsonymphae TaxID=1408203 RepID=UPI00358A8709|nr:preprotein translocase subunit SecE [Endomicrobium sp.]